jgi:hypothetical protein
MSESAMKEMFEGTFEINVEKLVKQSDTINHPEMVICEFDEEKANILWNNINDSLSD